MRSELIDVLSGTLTRILQNRPIDDEWDRSAADLLPEEEAEMEEVWLKLKTLHQMHAELQHFSVDLSKGELGATPPPRTNYLASGLKQLQMHLRHLSWQTQCISEGDYNQKVDFMGEFSEAFNKMVDQLRDRESKILAQRETMLRVFDQIEPVFIVAKDNPGMVLYANKMATHRFHLDEDSQLRMDLLLRFKTQCKPGTSEQVQDSDSGRWYRVSCQPFFWDREEDSLLYHCVDVTAHVKRENDLVQEAYTDKLTGLNNRYVFERSYDKLWDMCRQNQSPLSVIMFDIDFFKRCNDTYGHLQGDKCLVTFANIMRSNIGRFNDIIARFGGEEFIALLPFTNREAALKIAESVRSEMESTAIVMSVDDGRATETIHITVSGGVACKIPTFEDMQEELVSDADKALYDAKQSGRNRICVAA